MSNDSRDAMVATAAALIGSHGVSATSFSQVVSASGAPRGSIYHHFPLGKRQLAQDAIRWTSERVLAYQGAGEATTGAEVLERFIGMWREVVKGSGGAAGCVVAGVAIDTDRTAGDTTDSEEMESDGLEGDRTDGGGADLIDVVRETFRSWVALLVEQLEAVGVPAQSATPIAITTLAGMEGALILCRAEGNTAPLDAVAQQLLRLLPAP